MDNSTRDRNSWNGLCSRFGKKPRLLPREVTTRWNAFDEVLRVSIEMKEVLSEFIGIPETSG